MKTIILPKGSVQIFYTSIKNTPIFVELIVKQMLAMDNNVGFDFDKLRNDIALCQEMVRTDKKADAIGWLQNFYQTFFYASQKISFKLTAFALLTIDFETYQRNHFDIPSELLEQRINELNSFGITSEIVEKEISFFLPK